MRLEGLGKLKKKINYLIRIRTRDFPAYEMKMKSAQGLLSGGF
jgi:hypothetical protein